jgi:hypothetical protein
VIVRRAPAMLTVAAVLSCLGCQQIGSLLHLLRPAEIQKAEFVLDKQGPVAVLVDAPPARDESLLLARTLTDRLIDLFREHRSKTEFVPYERVLAIRRERPEFASWSVQRVGRELGVKQVVHVQVDSLVVRSAPTEPVITPQFTARVKVIGVDQAADQARQWPSEAEGRAVVCERPPREADRAAGDAAVVELGRLAARRIAEFFLDTDKEQPRVQEP